MPLFPAVFASNTSVCVCFSCNGAVNFLLDWDKDAKYRLAALQSKAGSELLQQAGRKPGDLSSVVLVEPGQAYVKSEAVLRIGRRLNTPFFVLGSMGLPVPSLMRDAAYDLVCKCMSYVILHQYSARLLSTQQLPGHIFSAPRSSVLAPQQISLPDCRSQTTDTNCLARLIHAECAIQASESASLKTEACLHVHCFFVNPFHGLVCSSSCMMLSFC